MPGALPGGAARAAARIMAAAVVTAVALGTAAAHPPPTPDPDLLACGRYLGEVVAFCGACHHSFGPGMQPIPGRELADGRVFAERGMRAAAPNITQDRETGIGAWTDAGIVAAIRQGHRPDGSLIGPPMPVESYRGIAPAARPCPEAAAPASRASRAAMGAASSVGSAAPRKAIAKSGTPGASRPASAAEAASQDAPQVTPKAMESCCAVPAIEVAADSLPPGTST